MSKTKTTHEHLIEAENDCILYLATHKTRFAYACKQILGRMKPLKKKFKEELMERFEEISIGLCLSSPPKDPDGALLRDAEGRYMLNRAGELECKAAQRKAQREMFAQEVEIEPYFVTYIPKDLSDDQIRIFRGLTIKEEDADRILAERDAEEASWPDEEPVALLEEDKSEGSSTEEATPIN